MHFLLVNQFYPPDMAPTGQHLHDLARCLVARGHSVRVLCSRRSYDGGGEYAAEEVRTVWRCGGSLGSALGDGGRRAGLTTSPSMSRPCWRAARVRFDLTLCLTTPPYVGLTVPRALRGRAAVAHWVMDLYPDVLAAHGGVSASGSSTECCRG